MSIFVFPFLYLKKVDYFSMFEGMKSRSSSYESPVCSRGQDKILPVSVEDSIHSPAIED